MWNWFTNNSNYYILHILIFFVLTNRMHLKIFPWLWSWQFATIVKSSVAPELRSSLLVLFFFSLIPIVAVSWVYLLFYYDNFKFTWPLSRADELPCRKLEFPKLFVGLLSLKWVFRAQQQTIIDNNFQLKLKLYLGDRDNPYLSTNWELYLNRIVISSIIQKKN